MKNRAKALKAIRFTTICELARQDGVTVEHIRTTAIDAARSQHGIKLTRNERENLVDEIKMAVKTIRPNKVARREQATSPAQYTA